MNKIKLIFIVISVFVGNAIYCQENLFHKDGRIDAELEIIEHLIHKKIDSLRAKKKLNELAENKHLRKAAKLHVVWMEGKGKLSHIQNKAKTKTPQKRVGFVGGNDALIGENIAYTLFNIELRTKKGKPYINASYEAIATDLVQMWRHSKGHYKNIITKGFYTTGIALAIDFEKNKIYAVQVFGGED